jgi:hypothetical protein
MTKPRPGLERRESTKLGENTLTFEQRRLKFEQPKSAETSTHQTDDPQSESQTEHLHLDQIYNDPSAGFSHDRKAGISNLESVAQKDSAEEQVEKKSGGRSSYVRVVSVRNSLIPVAQHVQGIEQKQKDQEEKTSPRSQDITPQSPSAAVSKRQSEIDESLHFSEFCEKRLNESNANFDLEQQQHILELSKAVVSLVRSDDEDIEEKNLALKAEFDKLNLFLARSMTGLLGQKSLLEKMLDGELGEESDLDLDEEKERLLKPECGKKIKPIIQALEISEWIIEACKQKQNSQKFRGDRASIFAEIPTNQTIRFIELRNKLVEEFEARAEVFFPRLLEDNAKAVEAEERANQEERVPFFFIKHLAIKALEKEVSDTVEVDEKAAEEDVEVPKMPAAIAEDPLEPSEENPQTQLEQPKPRSSKKVSFKQDLEEFIQYTKEVEYNVLQEGSNLEKMVFVSEPPSPSPAIRVSKTFTDNVAMRLQRFEHYYNVDPWFNVHSFIRVLGLACKFNETDDKAENFWSSTEIDSAHKRVLARFLLGETKWAAIPDREKLNQKFGLESAENLKEASKGLRMLISLVPQDEETRNNLFAEHNYFMVGDKLRREEVVKNFMIDLRLVSNQEGKSPAIQRVIERSREL